MKQLVYDTETVGLHGLAVLIQYQYNEDSIKLFSPWTEQVIETLKLIEWFMEQDNIGFNLAFDHFHLSKLYTIWSLLDPHAYPEDIIDEIAEKEPLGRNGFCIKPRRACDIMLWARKGKYQDTMQRKDIKIKKIHRSVAWEVRDYLEEHIKLDDIYFANRKNQFAPRWAVFDSKEGEEWKDIVLKFKPSGALKTLAVHALGHNPNQILRFGDLDGPQAPIEVGYAPFATALSSAEVGWRAKIKKGSGWKRGYCWPALVHLHISHWLNNRFARQYATDDVIYTKELYQHLGSPEPGDDDSELACMVGANRWRGYTIDFDKINNLEEQVKAEAKAAPKAPNAVRSYITEVMSDEEKEIYELTTEGSTKKTILEELRDTWFTNCDCKCVCRDNDISIWCARHGTEKCKKCDGTGQIKSEVAERADLCLRARQAKYRLDMINKLKMAGRFHASAEIIGTLSGRKSGRGGDFNSQGIARLEEIRECFKLAHAGMQLCGGDFEAFEVVLTIAVYKDEKMAQIIKDGKKIHAVFGTHFYPDMSYEQILNDKEIYTRSKSGLFALIYFGEAYTLKSRLGINIDDAEEGYQSFMKQFPTTAEGRKKVIKMFQSMTQPNGIGTRVIWKEPANKIETIFGFPRFFTLENQICKALFTLANKPPKEWAEKYGHIKIKRRDREQSVSGAVQSALYAAAFAIQGSNTRAGGNHVIQGSGAEITKHLERRIWDLQPSGVHTWVVQPMNEHDEVMVPCIPKKVNELNKTVNEVIEYYKPKVPLIAIDWHDNLNSWADK
jgi:hypothetical protein